MESATRSKGISAVQQSHGVFRQLRGRRRPVREDVLQLLRELDVWLEEA